MFCQQKVCSSQKLPICHVLYPSYDLKLLFCFKLDSRKFLPKFQITFFISLLFLYSVTFVASVFCHWELFAQENEWKLLALKTDWWPTLFYYWNRAQKNHQKFVTQRKFCKSIEIKKGAPLEATCKQTRWWRATLYKKLQKTEFSLDISTAKRAKLKVFKLRGGLFLGLAKPH